MKIKSYFAESVEAAVAQARKELGPEAMLVNSRRAPASSRKLGEYEVVFGLADGPTPAPKAVEIPQPDAAPASDLAQIRKQIAELQSALSGAGLSQQPAGRSPEWDSWREKLLAADVSSPLVDEILGKIQTQLSGATRPPADHIEDALRRELARRIQIANPFGGDGKGRVLALIGPPGAGKSATAAKIAAKEAIANGASAHILSLDPYRVAASEQLRTYASLLGAGFSVVRTFGELMKAMTACRSVDMVIIDTPGYTLTENTAARELSGFLQYFEEISSHLVLPASMKRADLSRATRVFEVFQPRSLIFTRIDETESWGTMLSQSAELGIGISYLASGQSIPEDLEPASAESFLGAILGPVRRALSVA
jgi:flagellar biosynthesis protein FlhF